MLGLIKFWKENPPPAEGIKLVLLNIGHEFASNKSLDEGSSVDYESMTDEEWEAEEAKWQAHYGVRHGG